MPPPAVDDYYALLGVHVGADAVELRRAWRRLAAQHHPDRAGHAAAAMFQRLSAAYEVLSDPLARAAYDRRRRRATGEPAGAAATAKTAPTRPAAPGVLLERLNGPLASLIACGAAEIGDDGVITLVLRAAEAAQGGMISVSMRVDVWCPQCSAPEGAARPQPVAPCPRCGGTRTVEELFAAWLAVPPGVMDGEALTPSAELDGMVRPVRFRVRFASCRTN